MGKHTRVSIYRRDSQGKYQFCDPRGNYSRDSTFVLRYTAESDRRVWETDAPTRHRPHHRKAQGAGARACAVWNADYFQSSGEGDGGAGLHEDQGRGRRVHRRAVGGRQPRA
jgi:hypothetical protein